MLPRSSPCELRLMLPDDKLSIDGFHDILVENLSGTPAWRSSHVSPADMTSLRRRWPKAVFNTLRRRASDVVVEEAAVVSSAGPAPLVMPVVEGIEYRQLRRSPECYLLQDSLHSYFLRMIEGWTLTTYVRGSVDLHR